MKRIAILGKEIERRALFNQLVSRYDKTDLRSYTYSLSCCNYTLADGSETCKTYGSSDSIRGAIADVIYCSKTMTVEEIERSAMYLSHGMDYEVIFYDITEI